LTGTGIPSWVNRVAKIGNALKGIVGGDDAKTDAETTGQPLPLLPPQITEYKDLTSEIDILHVGCLNQHPQHPMSDLFQKPKGKFLGSKKELYLESDVDEQLLIFIPFKANVKIHSILICSPQGYGPKVIKLFVNKKDMDFSNAESTTPTQILTLDATQLTGEGTPILLKFVSFQNVTNLSIFIESNLGGKETTQLSKLSLIGLTTATMNVGDLK